MCATPSPLNRQLVLFGSMVYCQTGLVAWLAKKGNSQSANYLSIQLRPDRPVNMRANLATIHGRLETILENLEHIPDTQEVTPDLCHEDPDSPLSQLGHHWLQFWSISYPQVRNERNLARDEAKQLRVNLEAAVKDSNSHKRDKNDLELQIGQLKKEMEKVHLMLIKHAGQFDANGEGGAGAEDGKAGEISPDLSSSDGLKRSGVILREAVNREDGLVSNGCECKTMVLLTRFLYYQGSVENRLGDIDLSKGKRFAFPLEWVESILLVFSDTP